MTPEETKQQLIVHLSNPNVLIHEFAIDASESDGVKLSFRCVTIDLDEDRNRRDWQFIRNVEDALKH